MSKSRVSNSRRKTSRETEQSNSVHRFVGVSLSGGRSDRTCICVLEFYPKSPRAFITRIFEKIKNEEYHSADLKIHEIVNQLGGNVESILYDVPLSFPVCIDCKLKCPGYEVCNVTSIKWMRELYKEINAKKKPLKSFTPYTQRCVEAYLMNKTEQNFEVQHSLGSNSAPLTARAHFIRRRLGIPSLEVNPRIAVWRIGTEMRISNGYLKNYKNDSDSDEKRKYFLQQMIERKGLFIYQQDLKILVENHHAFDAFVCAYTGYLNYQGLCEERPKGFPAKEAWVTIPKESLK